MATDPSQVGWDTHYVLNLGCGIKCKVKKGINLDVNPKVEPDVVHDLNKLPLPFEDNTFDRCIMSHIFEHLGDPWSIKKPYVQWFFEFWAEIWRVLKPGGLIQFTSPNINNTLTWGDPGHTRAITLQTLSFLSKDTYELNANMDASPMTQYGIEFDFDFLQPAHLSVDKLFICAIMRAIKE